ncbi:hypothetical protein BH24CHL1_BH24CHL1_16430 [soil metagenome]
MALTTPPSIDDRIKISEAARNAPACTVVAAAAILRAVGDNQTDESVSRYAGVARAPGGYRVNRCVRAAGTRTLRL